MGLHVGANFTQTSRGFGLPQLSSALPPLEALAPLPRWETKQPLVLGSGPGSLSVHYLVDHKQPCRWRLSFPSDRRVYCLGQHS